jgi:hypothetical protein
MYCCGLIMQWKIVIMSMTYNELSVCDNSRAVDNRYL